MHEVGDQIAERGFRLRHAWELAGELDADRPRTLRARALEIGGDRAEHLHIALHGRAFVRAACTLRLVERLAAQRLRREDVRREHATARGFELEVDATECARV